MPEGCARLAQLGHVRSEFRDATFWGFVIDDRALALLRLATDATNSARRIYVPEGPNILCHLGLAHAGTRSHTGGSRTGPGQVPNSISSESCRRRGSWSKSKFPSTTLADPVNGVDRCGGRELHLFISVTRHNSWRHQIGPDSGCLRGVRGEWFLLYLPLDDVVAKIDAFIADVDRWSGDQLAHVILMLAAE